MWQSRTVSWHSRTRRLPQVQKLIACRIRRYGQHAVPGHLGRHASHSSSWSNYPATRRKGIHQFCQCAEPSVCTRPSLASERQPSHSWGWRRPPLIPAMADAASSTQARTCWRADTRQSQPVDDQSKVMSTTRKAVLRAGSTTTDRSGSCLSGSALPRRMTRPGGTVAMLCTSEAAWAPAGTETPPLSLTTPDWTDVASFCFGAAPVPPQMIKATTASRAPCANRIMTEASEPLDANDSAIQANNGFRIHPEYKPVGRRSTGQA